MRNITLLSILAVGVVSASSSDAFLFEQPKSMKADIDNLSCIIYDDLTVFNIKALEHATGYSKNGFSFNFCKRFNVTDPSTGKSSETYVFKEAAGSSVESPKGTAYAMDSYPSTTDAVEANEATGEPRHLSVYFKSAAVCRESSFGNNEFWKTNFEIFCDAEGSLKKDLLPEDFNLTHDSDACLLKITTRHKAGCPVVEATAIINYLAKNPAIAGMILLAFGVLANFFGGRIFHLVIALVGGVTLFFIMLLILSAIGGLKALDSHNAGPGHIILAILSFTVAIASGFGLAYLTRRYKRFGAGLFGFVVGFFVGYYIHKILFARFISSQLVRLIIIASSAIATGIYSFNWSKTLTVPMTSVFGSFMIIRGFSMFAGGFPTEMLGDYEDKLVFEVKDSYIYYLIAYIFLLVGGVAYQRHRNYHMLYEHDDFEVLASINHSGKDDDYMRMHLMH